MKTCRVKDGFVVGPGLHIVPGPLDGTAEHHAEDHPKNLQRWGGRIIVLNRVWWQKGMQSGALCGWQHSCTHLFSDLLYWVIMYHFLTLQALTHHNKNSPSLSGFTVPSLIWKVWTRVLKTLTSIWTHAIILYWLFSGRNNIYHGTNLWVNTTEGR